MSWPEALASSLTAWRPRERLGGAAWAERDRMLSAEESPSPGPWRCVPWQREVLDAFASAELEWIVVLKAAQVGVSELVRCAIGRWAALDPGDVLWVMATEQAATKAMRKLQVMFRSTPSLRPLLSERRSDTTLLELVLTTGMRIVIGWAGSAQSLASDPFRRVILDEVGKYRWSVQGEASPVDLAKERTKVFGRRGQIILLSSPKHDEDLICTSFHDVADRRAFAVPCPGCKSPQTIEWSFVRWPGGEPALAPSDRETRVRLADEVEKDQSAWVECRSCHGRILPHLNQYDAGSRWVPEGAAPIAGSRRRAYHVPEFFHWETTISGLVAKFLRCTTPSAIQGFWNGSLGLPGRLESSPIQASTFISRANHPSRIVPDWATTVIATADTQLHGYWYCLRAWGPGQRSRLLDWGFVENEEELRARCLESAFEVEGAPDARARPLMLAIDTGGGMDLADGSRTQQVYAFALNTPRVFALKGQGGLEALQGVPTRATGIRTGAGSRLERTLELHLVNKTYYADMLAALIKAEPVLWEECQGAENPIYSRHMTSEHKVLKKDSRGERWLWEKRSKGIPNHIWDCSRYQCWAAEFLRINERKQATWSAQPIRVAVPDPERPRQRRWVGR